MKHAGRLLSFLLVLQFFLGGIPYTPLQSVAWSTTCPAGQQWSDVVSRCVSAAEASQLQSASAGCNAKATEGEKTQCYMQALQAKVKDGEASGEIGGSSKVNMSKVSILLAMASLISGITTIKYLTGCPGATSGWLMTGAAASIFLGEVMSGLKFQSKSKEAVERFNKAAKNAEAAKVASNSQAEAFGAMADREQATIDAAKTKNIFYMVSTAAYTAAGVMSAIEIIKSKIPGFQKLYYCPEVTAAQAEQLAVTSTAAGTTQTVAIAAGQVALTTTTMTAGIGATGLALGAGGVLTGTMLVSSLGGSGGGGEFNTNQQVTPPASGGAPATSPNFEDTPPPGVDEVPPTTYLPATLEDGSIIISSAVNKYIDNYFLKKQRVSFNAFSSTGLMATANGWADLNVIASELHAIQEGANESPTLEDFDRASAAVASMNLKHSYEEFTMMKLALMVTQQFTIQEVKASDLLKGLVMILGMGGIGYAGAALLVAKSYTLTSMFIAPETRLALSGVMLVNNIFMINHTNKEKKKAEQRKAFIEKLKGQVETPGPAIACANPSDPGCRPGGGTTGGSVPIVAQGGQRPRSAGYGIAGSAARSNARTVGCVNKTGATDSSCSCRNTNSCVSVAIPSNLGTGPMGADLKGVANTLNALNSGLLAAEDVDTSRINNAMAVRLSKAKDRIINDPKNKDLRKAAEKAEKLSIDTMNALARDIANTPELMNAPMSGVASDSTLSGSPKAVMEQLKEELKINRISEGGTTIPTGNDSGSLEALEPAAPLDPADEKLAEAMGSEYDMGNSDINTDSSTSIFDIVSNRYKRSGIRRLTGREAIMPVDAPAKPISP